MIQSQKTNLEVVEKVLNGNCWKNFNWGKKWMIAGGLNINNVKEAIEISKAPVVDISSGVEKNLELNVKK